MLSWAFAKADYRKIGSLVLFRYLPNLDYIYRQFLQESRVITLPAIATYKKKSYIAFLWIRRNRMRRYGS